MENNKEPLINQDGVKKSMTFSNAKMDSLISKTKKTLIESLWVDIIYIIYFGIFLLLQITDDPLCDFPSYDYVKYFVLLVNVLFGISKVVVLLQINTSNISSPLSAMAIQFTEGIVITVFFYYGIINIWDKNCWSTMTWNFTNTFIIVLASFKAAVVLSFVTLMFLCCLPCFCAAGCAMLGGASQELPTTNNTGEAQSQFRPMATQNMMRMLTKTAFGPSAVAN